MRKAAMVLAFAGDSTIIKFFIRASLLFKDKFLYIKD